MAGARVCRLQKLQADAGSDSLLYILVSLELDIDGEEISRDRLFSTTSLKRIRYNWMSTEKKERASLGGPSLRRLPPTFYSMKSTTNKWERQDSNLRRKPSTDLQSAAFDHSATLPSFLSGRKPPWESSLIRRKVPFVLKWRKEDGAPYFFIRLASVPGESISSFSKFITIYVKQGAKLIRKKAPHCHRRLSLPQPPSLLLAKWRRRGLASFWRSSEWRSKWMKEPASIEWSATVPRRVIFLKGVTILIWFPST